jgi:hypothetical protein
MSSSSDVLGQLPIWAIAVVGALIVLQLSLQVTALVQAVRTPAERITLGGRKWLWILIIVLGEMLGPILWFLLGRSKVVAVDVAAAQDKERTQQVADALYGSPKAGE